MVVVFVHSLGENVSTVIPSYRLDVPEGDLERDAHHEDEAVLKPELIILPFPSTAASYRVSEVLDTRLVSFLC